LLYRQPAYLICSDPNLPIEQLLQAYLWRWEIELAFREEKTLMGMGEAQVTNENAIESTPTFIAAAYALIHVAAIKAGIISSGIVKPKWRKKGEKENCTTSQLITRLRAELWGKSLGVHFDDFVDSATKRQSLRNTPSKLGSAVLNAFR
jgi:hypothetical protein